MANAIFSQGGQALELKRFVRELLGIFLIFCALFLLLALLTFDANDPSVNYVKSGVQELHNKAGLFGAYAAGFLDDFFGVGALLWPCVFAALGAAHLSNSITLHWWRWTGLFLLTLCLLSFASAVDLGVGDLAGGGMVGKALHGNSVHWFSPFGSFLLWFFVFMAGIQLVANFSWMGLYQIARSRFTAHWQKSGANGENNNSAPDTKSGRLSDTLIRGKQSWEAMLAKFKQLTAKFPRTGTGDAPAESAADAEGRGTLSPACKPEISQSTPGRGEQEDIPARPQVAAPLIPHPRTVALTEDDEPFAPSQQLRPGSERPAVPDPFGQVPASPVPVAGAPQSPSDTRGHALPEQVVPAVDEALPLEPTDQETTVSLRLFNESPDNVEPVLPSTELLNMPGPAMAASPEDLQAKGQALMNCFNDFDIHGELARITPGPVVTMFEVRPAAGIRVSKIANLADDLSLALKAVAVRIQAPIPGSDTVGIEIPNDIRETVNFRELAESPAFQQGEGPLTMILGKNIAGLPFMADLTRMPHMLVAGATGAGKSVCLNSILVSLLYKLPPRDMRLLLVDPKRIELAIYADLPHLVHPVVTEMDDAKNALDWAVQDMKKRYKTFERLGVRNIIAYHQKLASFGDTLPSGLEDLAHMPYLVIVIDELADLMMTAAREVETSIVRLAQLARAAGIHMILATQRPSVDVVTGLIKANFPCRISFQVTSKHDSRTILDQVGAEHLLGRGDMLFKPSGGRLLRLHGPFLSDEEVQAVASHWKAQQPPDYQVDFSQWTAEMAQSNPSVGGDATSDALYGEAKSFVLSHGRASISLLQRHLKIGFNRAARLMEQFERDGLIGPADGSKPRTVIK